jgi:precorrin-6Y C5,15-methyltransferase (decarboxylating)
VTGPWLTVVGIGADGPDGLAPQAREAVASAEVLVGGARHLATLPDDGRPRLAWRSPLAGTLAEILDQRPRPVAVLATGDPLWYGVGRLLLRHVPAAEVRILPHVSAFQEACSRLGWAVEDTHALSVHGRPVDALRRHLQPARRLLALTSDGAGPAEVAALLEAEGYGASRFWVMEELGGPRERTTAATATEIGDRRFGDLNTVAAELARSSGGAPPLPLVPGLPDEAYEHDGQLTKAEVRATTLAALAPLDGELLWDVGAGAGSVAIEWLRSGRGMRAVAVERDPARAQRIAANARRLGVPELELRLGEAPEALQDLPTPAAVFVGGGIAAPGLLDRCWGKLGAGGRLVANAVTVAGEAALLAFQARHGSKLLRIALSRSDLVGAQLVWRPAMPVTQLSARKPCAAASS